jgi:UDP-GlcNAc:undecaprenyl-phosphate GlcNAc-1-phosphate transferase
MRFLFFLFVQVFLLLAFFKVAKRFQWVDIPNNRSTHRHETVVGGGIIIAGCFGGYLIFFHIELLYIAMAILMISIVGFLDDLKDLPWELRLVFQFIAIILASFQVGLFYSFDIIITCLILFLYLSWINAFNFMDGLNGMSALYSIVAATSLLYINYNIVQFTQARLILLLVAGLVAFGFFNIRKAAISFMGDAGALSIPLILGYFLITLMIATDNWFFIGLFMLFGIDAFFTVVERILKGHNIAKAHRLHLYQLMADKTDWSHLKISFAYASIQLIINSAIIVSFSRQDISNGFAFIVITLSISGLYLYLRFKYFKTLTNDSHL